VKKKEIEKREGDLLPWWKSGVLYQVYPRSFQDTNSDGIGDLRGVIRRLDHFESLGIDGIWLSPTMPSPNADFGYDVADYCAVNPEYGTMSDLVELIARAGERDINVLLDLVPNHTSDEHPWFEESRSSKDSPKRDWYVWRPPKPDGSLPNNWVSAFGGPAWEFDEKTGEYYLHLFNAKQPDLNWWNEEVRAAFDDILRFWFDRGIAGFRIDVAHGIIKDKQLRDNPPPEPDDPPAVRRIGQRAVYSMNQPEVHEILKRWRKVASEYEPERILVGETWVLDLDHMATFYGDQSDELHLSMNFPLVFGPFDSESFPTTVADTETVVPSDGWPLWFGSNHDVIRFPTRWCNENWEKSRLALMVLLTLRGTPLLYYGDEIGMPNADLPREAILDPVGLAFWPEDKGRDGCRTPMQWSAEEGAGFSDPDVTPWLPYGDYESINVSRQEDDPDSVLTFTRDLIALRRRTPDIVTGAYERIKSPPGTWVYRRGESVVVALNMSDDEATIEGITGTIALASDRSREDETVSGPIEFAPWTGGVILTG
jgi:alpha-glucosidase